MIKLKQPSGLVVAVVSQIYRNWRRENKSVSEKKEGNSYFNLAFYLPFFLTRASR